MPEKEVQKLFAQNRRDYEPELRKILNAGSWIIAEDYKGTGISWGLVRGLSLKYLEKINEDLFLEDLAIVLYGERFRSGKEQSHRNEADDTIWKTAQEKHLFLADRYRWHKVFANQSHE